MKDKKVRVRIAPSPTGFAHIGTAYTALFNWGYARANDGTFVIRIEDSDQERHVEASVKAIYDAISWLGLNWDEGVVGGGPYEPYRITEKLEVYRNKAEELIEKGLAYEDDGAIRFKNTGKDQSWNDLIRGEISFPGEEITDFVIIKSDKNPTYNFAVVVDDIEMEITHVIRGEEHISNTPRQLALYEAFGALPPKFAHHPLLVNEKRQKLSKRKDPVNVEHYKEKGYLPEALLNFLALLGWAHPEQKEIFSMEEFVTEFDIKDVRKSAAYFDTKKLDWMNGEYIRNLSDEEFVVRLSSYIPKDWDINIVKEIAPLSKTRISALSEFRDLCEFLFKKPKIADIKPSEDDMNHIRVAYEVIEGLNEWELEGLNEALMKQIEEKEFKVGKFFMSLRLALSGKNVTPPINESIIILGKDEVLKRLGKLL